MIVYGTESEFAKRLAQNILTRIDVSGNIYLTSEHPSTIKSPNVAGSSDDDATRIAADHQGSCYSHKQCDTANGFVCAQPFKVDLVPEKAWTSFSCVALAATLSVARTYKQCSTGRCLLEGDGTVSIQTDGNNSYAETLYEVYVNKTHTNSTLANQTKEISTPIPPGKSYHPPANLTSHTPAFLNNSNYPLQPGMFLPQICPCNCTFWGTSCCFSDIVYTATIPDETNHTSPLPGLHCDRVSGEWLPLNGTANSTGSIAPGSAGSSSNSLSKSTTTSYFSSTSSASLDTSISTSTRSSDTSSFVGIQAISTISAETAKETPAPSTAHPVCSTIGNRCTSYWSCGDGEHCYCSAVPHTFLGLTYFYCVPKVGYGPINTTSSSSSSSGSTSGSTSINGNTDKKRRDDNDDNGPSQDPLMTIPSFEDAICPCNCTYSSHACCEEPSGIVYEPPGRNQGRAYLPIGQCCDDGDGQVKTVGSCSIYQ